jgi:DNA repair exonuclease SbcCD ATPase subunit
MKSDVLETTLTEQ